MYNMAFFICIVTFMCVYNILTPITSDAYTYVYLCTQTIEVVKGNILDNNDWVEEADVCFISCTCFDEELVTAISLKARECKPTCIFITLDKTLGDHFQVVKCTTAVMSWGLCTVYVSQLIIEKNLQIRVCS